MADVKISDLTDGTAVASGDLAEIERPGDPNVSRRVPLGDAAGKDVGTTAGTVAAGDDSRIVGAVQKAGDTMTGGLALPAGTTSLVPLRIPHGAAHDTPTNGDFWTQDDGVYAHINGVTQKLAAVSYTGEFDFLDFDIDDAPADPAAGNLRLYAKTGGVLAYRDESGTEVEIGGGAGGTVDFYNNTTSQSISSTSLVNIEGLSFSLSPDEEVVFTAYIPFVHNAGSSTTKTFGADGPASPSSVLLSLSGIQLAANDVNPEPLYGFRTSYGGMEGLSVSKARGGIAILSGKIVNGANSGTVNLQAARSSITMTISEGSHVIVYRST